MDILASRPQTYTGAFRWYGDLIDQKVDIRINTVKQRDEHSVEVIGCGQYDAAGRVTDIGVRMLIDSVSLNVEIWEFNPVGSRTFDVDGSHKGMFHDNLKVIDAEWLSRSTQRIGRLQLRAGGSFSCAVNVS
jgi:hypothetical protein